MKRRLFLQCLLGASAIVPVVAKASTEPEHKKDYPWPDKKEVAGAFIMPKYGSKEHSRIVGKTFARREQDYYNLTRQYT